MGAAQANEPGLLLAATPLGGGPDQVGAPGRMEGPGRVALAGIGEALLGVLADCLEEAVRGRPVERRLGNDHRLVDEAAERGEGVVAGLLLAPHGDGRRGVEAAPEDGHPAEHPALRRGEQVVAPVDRGAHRPVALDRRISRSAPAGRGGPGGAHRSRPARGSAGGPPPARLPVAARRAAGRARRHWQCSRR